MHKLLIGSAMSLLGHVYMNAEGAAEAPAATGTGIRIRPDLSNYQTAKSASGSSTKICGDEISVALVGATLDETYGFVAGVIEVPEAELRAKYAERNPGQQRMFLGNLIRGAYAGKDKERAARVKSQFDKNVGEFRKGVDERLSTVVAEAEKLKAEAKAKRDAEKEEAKAKRDAEKAEKAKVAAAAKEQAQKEKLAKQLTEKSKPKAPKEPGQPTE